jgi:hypothetical protein
MPQEEEDEDDAHGRMGMKKNLMMKMKIIMLASWWGCANATPSLPKQRHPIAA